MKKRIAEAAGKYNDLWAGDAGAEEKIIQALKATGQNGGDDGRWG